MKPLELLPPSSSEFRFPEPSYASGSQPFLIWQVAWCCWCDNFGLGRVRTALPPTPPVSCGLQDALSIERGV